MKGEKGLHAGNWGLPCLLGDSKQEKNEFTLKLPRLQALGGRSSCPQDEL